MDKALVFGSKGCRFESCQGHMELFTFAPLMGALAAVVPPAREKRHGLHGKQKGTEWRTSSSGSGLAHAISRR
eukprot:749006-Amphidinium_carterae.2